MLKKKLFQLNVVSKLGFKLHRDLVYAEWNKDPGRYCSEVWPKWDEGLSDETKKKYNIIDIGNNLILGCPN